MSYQDTAEFKRRELSLKIEKAVLYGVFGLLLFGPLAFGAVEPWSIFFLEAGSAALLLGWMGRQVLEGRLKVRWNPLFLPMAAFGTLICKQLVFHTTAYAHDTVAIALLYGAYALLCFLATQIFLRGAQARTLAWIFSAYGTALACFALVQGISSNGKLYWMRQPRTGGWIYGPYVNHNHYAGLMEMLVPIPLVVSLARLTPPKLRGVAGACAATMVGTIFLSGSRGGMIAILVELVVLAALLVKQKSGLRTAVTIGLFLALLVGMLTWVGGNDLMQRLSTVGPGHTELAGDFRSAINRDGLRMFLERPAFGWGLGAFPIVYPQFRSFYTNFFVNQAHNDYLQLLVEMGLAGFATMLWFVVTVYVRAGKKIANWPTDISGALTLACVLGMTGILVHSFLDFNLQIPANAALFFVGCTVAASEPFVKPARKRRAVRRTITEAKLDAEESLQPSGTNF